MNIGLDFRGGLDRLPNVLEAVVARINTIWKKQHNADGTHGDVTVSGDLAVSGDVTVGGDLTGPAGDPLLSQTFLTEAAEAANGLPNSRRLVAGAYVALSAATPGQLVVSATGGGAPAAHAPTHKSGGSDPIKLDELAAPTDVPTLNASTAAHGLLRKLPGDGSLFLDGMGSFNAPPPPPGYANVAYRNIDNNFSVAQTFKDYTKVSDNNGLFVLNRTACPADARYWRFLNYGGGGNLTLEALNDSRTITAIGAKRKM